MKETVSQRIRILSFFMTCGMVLYHCMNLDGSLAFGAFDEAFSVQMYNVFFELGILVMSYFFTVTGYLLFSGYELKQYPAKIKRRFFSLLVPYFAWQCIFGAWEMIRGAEAFSLTAFLTRVFGLVMWPYDGPLWYVYAVFLMALVSPLLLMVFRNRRMGWGVVLVLILLNSVRNHITNPVIVKIMLHGYVGNILLYVPSFLLGCFLGKFSEEMTLEQVIGCLMSLLVMGCLLDGVLPGTLSNISMQLAAALALFTLPIVPALLDRKIYSLNFLMYAIHLPLISAVWPYLSRICARIPLPVSIWNILTRLLILTADIALAWLLQAGLRRFAPRVLRILTGGRK